MIDGIDAKCALSENCLRMNCSIFSAIIENLFEAILLIDGAGNIEFANRSANDILLESFGTAAGHQIDSIFSVVEEGRDIPFIDSRIAESLRKGRACRNDDTQIRTTRGKRLYVGYACSPLIRDGVDKAVLCLWNIEAFKSAQRDALQSSRMASVGQLAAGIAHEINTPTQYIGDNLRFLRDGFEGIRSVLDSMQMLLQRAKDNADPGRSVAAVEEAVQKADLEYLLAEIPAAISQSLDGIGAVARIVGSMKEFSHPGNGSKTYTDLNRAIEATLTVCRNEWKSVAVIETALDKELPPILCFPGEINQVLLNLIVNAAQALESQRRDGPGTICITTSKLGSSVILRIRDDGPGIPVQIREKIFDPFFTTKEVGKGTGQGLYLCHEIVVNKHNGRIYIDDTSEVGAAFVVELPIGDAGNEAL